LLFPVDIIGITAVVKWSAVCLYWKVGH